MNKKYLIIAASVIAATALTAGTEEDDGMGLNALFAESKKSERPEDRKKPQESTGKKPAKPKASKAERTKKWLDLHVAKLEKANKRMADNQEQQLALRSKGRELAAKLKDIDKERQDTLDQVEKTKSELSTLQTDRDTLQKTKDRLNKQIEGLKKSHKKHNDREAKRAEDDDLVTESESSKKPFKGFPKNDDSTKSRRSSKIDELLAKSTKSEENDAKGNRLRRIKSSLS